MIEAVPCGSSSCKSFREVGTHRTTWNARLFVDAWLIFTARVLGSREIPLSDILSIDDLGIKVLTLDGILWLDTSPA